MSSCVHMYVAGDVAPKCVVPGATDQRSLRQSILLISWAYVMMHFVLSVEMGLMSLNGWIVTDAHPVGQGYPGSLGT